MADVMRSRGAKFQAGIDGDVSCIAALRSTGLWNHRDILSHYEAAKLQARHDLGTFKPIGELAQKVVMSASEQMLRALAAERASAGK